MVTSAALSALLPLAKVSTVLAVTSGLRYLWWSVVTIYGRWVVVGGY